MINKSTPDVDGMVAGIENTLKAFWGNHITCDFQLQHLAEICRLARLGAQLDASSNPNELLPLNTNMPLDESLATVHHVMVVGWKDFFNSQYLADCFGTVRRLSKLGQAVEKIPKGATLFHTIDDHWMFDGGGDTGYFPVNLMLVEALGIE